MLFFHKVGVPKDQLALHLAYLDQLKKYIFN